MRKFIPPSIQPGSVLRMTAFGLAISLCCTSPTQATTLSNGMAPKRAAFANDQNAVDRVITGRVVDETSSALPGVSIVLKGSSRGTVTGKTTCSPAHVMLLRLVKTLSRGALCQTSFASPVVGSAIISDSP